MDLQCNLEVEFNNQKVRHQLTLYPEDCLLELADEQIEVIPEYRAFDIMINAGNSNEGYFELPELVDYEIQNREDNVKLNDGESYNFNQRYCVFANNWETSKSPTDLQTVPLTPGYYTVRVTLSTGEKLFAYWYVKPKELTTPEWQVMRDDVEQMVKGLALDYSRQMRSNVRNTQGAESRSILDDDTAFLVKKETRIRYAVETLRNEAKYQISKTYSWVPAGTRNEVDQQTIRKIGERPDKRGMLYAPKRYLKFDVAANQWLKLFLMRLVKFCGAQIDYNRQVEIEVKEEYGGQQKYFNRWTESERQHSEKSFANNISDLQEAVIKLRKLQEYLRLVLNDAFLKSASMPSNTTLPKALMLNASYNLLYRVYMVLFQRKEQFTLAKSYRRYWKKTAQLYEIWTFVHVIQSLIRLGLKPTGGWVYDTYGRDRVLPFLKEGTQVHFSTDELLVNLTYNETIPSDRNKTSSAKPLFTLSNRNKPDIRIDVFNLKKQYLGSILLDAKYIRISNILKRVGTSLGHSRLKEQFLSYVHETETTFLDDYKVMKDVRPVRVLLVLYPTCDDSDYLVIESKYTGRDVQYIQVRPGENESNLDKSIYDNLDEIKERSKYFKAFDIMKSHG